MGRWGVSLAVLATALLVQPATAEDERAHWGYDAPERWSDLSVAYSACGVGGEQSPINIVPSATIDGAVPPVELHWTAFAPEVVNNGHTIQVNANGAGGHALLDGRRYDLVQYHFHHLSEHALAGWHAPMEVHFVHAGADGDLLVIGTFVVAGDANSAFDVLWPAIPDTGHAQAVETPVDPHLLMPASGEFYRYAGSLTTPPCSEIATWTVMVEPVTASEGQIAAFADLYPGNYRPAQPVGRRYVLHSD